MPKAATVVVPSWNGKELLTSVCLPSLATQTFRDFSIIVVDNGSTDGSATHLRSEWPDVGVIELAHNSGFAAAVNRGIEASASEFVALVNNDVELDRRWLEEMVSAAQGMPQAGSMACRMMNFDDRTLIAAAGDSVSTDGHIFARGWLERDTGQFERMEPVLSACAGAALYRREALDAVGPFDEDFFAYYENVDWGFRAQLAGFSRWYVPAAIAYHVGGATSSRVSGMRPTLLMRNAYLLVLKDFPLEIVVRNFPRLSFRIIRRFYRAFRHGRSREGFEALVQAVQLTPRMVQKRHENHDSRRVGHADIAELMTRDAPLRSRKIERLQTLLRRKPSSSNGTRE